MTTADAPSPAVTFIFVEGALWTPDEAWTAALEHVAQRFHRAHPLDVGAVVAAGELGAQVEVLQAWAGQSGVDLDRELGRYLDEHLSMHLRPDASRTRAVRAIAAAGPVHLVSALPARAAESLARHAGVWRSVAQLYPDVRTDTVLAAVLGTASTSAVIRTASQLTAARS